MRTWTYYYYYNRSEYFGQSYLYTDQEGNNQAHAHVGSTCATGGMALIACGSLCFIGVSLRLLLHLIRRLNQMSVVPIVGNDKAAYLRLEVVLACWNLLFFFLMSVIWGATCFSAVKNSQDTDDNNYMLRPTGYTYICVCTGFAFIGVLLSFYVRRLSQPETQPERSVTPKAEQTEGDSL
jgi:hypothetical protein